MRQVSYIGADHVVFGWNGPNQFQFHNAVFQSFTQKVQKLRASEVQVEGGYVRTKMMFNGYSGMGSAVYGLMMYQKSDLTQNPLY